MGKWRAQKFVTHLQMKSLAAPLFLTDYLEDQVPDYLDYLDRALCREGHVERFNRQDDDWVEFKKVWY